jgi:NADH dehydrogenase
VEALVRSQRARERLLSHSGEREALNITVADPRDPAAVAEVGSRCDQAVHLIGTIRETRDNPYVDSHDRPAQALIDAVPDTAIAHIVYLSILGADEASRSGCLRARAAAENCLMSAKTSVTVIRIPMVLGEKDRASFALAKRAAAKRVVLFRADSREQPIYAGDVVAAMVNALKAGAAENQVFNLAGPESLSHRELVARAGLVLDNRPSIISLPLGVGMGLAGLLELLTRTPPMSREMLRVLDHDDDIDPSAACAVLRISLTPLDEILRRCIRDRLA